MSRARRYGSPFWDSVIKGPGCWEWTASRQRFGHGTKWHNGAVRLVHRIAWEEANGPIPHGLCVLHRCDNPSCVRPEHLFLGTKGDNNVDRNTKGRSRSHNRGITQCLRGHWYTPENTHLDRFGKRSCRTCRAAAQAAYLARRKDANAQAQR
jgi:hypothetical protein